MANKGRFTIDGIIWDSILSVVAEDSNHNVLYRMPDVSDGTVEVNADSKDSTDKNGATIKKGYTAKSCSVTLTNTHLVLGAYAGTTGSDKVVATSESKQDAPRMMLIDPANKDVTLKEDPIEGTLSVTPVYANGSTGTTYKMASDSTATASEYAYTTGTKKLSFPTTIAEEVAQLLVKYEYKSENAVMVENRADKFPKTVKLTIQGLYYDPCDNDVLLMGYIVIPKFQPSPETSVSMSTDSTFDYKGDAQADYCDKNRRLYYMVFPGDDIQED